MASSTTKASLSSSSPSKSSSTATQEQSHSSQTTGGGGGGLQASSEDFLDNPTRDTLAEGLNGLLAPSIEQLDAGIANARGAQLELQEQISRLESQLATINSEQQCPVDLEAYVNKLNTAKKRVVVVNNILQGAQDRLNKIHQNCLKETAKRRTLLEPSSVDTAATNLAKLQTK